MQYLLYHSFVDGHLGCFFSLLKADWSAYTMAILVAMVAICCLQADVLIFYPYSFPVGKVNLIIFWCSIALSRLFRSYLFLTKFYYSLVARIGSHRPFLLEVLCRWRRKLKEERVKTVFLLISGFTGAELSLTGAELLGAYYPTWPRSEGPQKWNSSEKK